MSAVDYVAHLLPLVLAVEIWLLVLNLPYGDRRTRQRRLVRKLWQTRVMWTGMAPVYAKAVILAIVGGPNRKPTYVVTRKEDDIRWHWRHTLPQTTLVLGVLCVLVYGLRYGTLPSLALLAGSVYWGGLNIALHELRHPQLVRAQADAAGSQANRRRDGGRRGRGRRFRGARVLAQLTARSGSLRAQWPSLGCPCSRGPSTTTSTCAARACTSPSSAAATRRRCCSCTAGPSTGGHGVR